jgi:predicted phage terminase large subunit-like protein
MMYKRKRKLSKKEFEKQVANILALQQTAVKPFPDCSEDAKKARRERGRKDIEYFKKTYFPHYFTAESGEIHKELHQFCRLGQKSISALAYPRKFGKSTNVTFVEPIHQAVYEISPFTMLISDIKDTSEEFLTYIKLEFEENIRLRTDFGDLVTAGLWEKDDIVIGGKARIMAVGARQNIRGKRFRNFRPTLMLIDDLENDVNVLNKKLVKRTFNWILGAVFPSLDDNGSLVMIGTMLDKISVLSLLIDHIREKGPEIEEEFGVSVMNARIYSAITPEGKSLWPEGMPLALLKRIKKQVGPSVWAKEFMNMPLDTAIYKLDWFDYYEPEVIVNRKRYWNYFSGSDPSARDTEKHDYKAHVVVAQDRESKTIYVVEAWIQHSPISNFNNAFIDLYQEYNMATSLYEENSYQMYLKEELQRICKERGAYPNIKGVTHTSDKVMRIGRFEAAVERGDIKFQKKHSDQEILIEQLHCLGTNMNDDGADAWEMALHAAEMGASRRIRSRSSGRRRAILSKGVRPSFTMKREYYVN